MKYIIGIIIAILLGIYVVTPYTHSNALDTFYSEYRPHTVYVGIINGEEMYILDAEGKSERQIEGIKRPCNPSVNAVLNSMMNPVPQCLVIKAEHIEDERFRAVTQSEKIDVLQLCPIHTDGFLRGYVGVYLEEGDERDLLVPLKQLSEKL